MENAAQALRNAERARLNEYVADMNVTNHSLEDGNFGRASQLIEKHRPQAGATDLRGFEWRYLASQSQGDEHFAYPLQGGAIYTLAFSGDGVLLAVGLEREIDQGYLGTETGGSGSGDESGSASPYHDHVVGAIWCRVLPVRGMNVRLEFLIVRVEWE